MKFTLFLLWIALNFSSDRGFSMTSGFSTGPISNKLAVKNGMLPASTTHFYKSFREWKAAMIAAAIEKLNQSQQALAVKQRLSASTTDPNNYYKSKPEAGLNSQTEELQRQAEKDQYQLSITKDLTISDYFVGYLTVQKDVSATINDVSSRLSPDEIAELMHAYANNFFSSKPSSQPSAPRADANQ